MTVRPNIAAMAGYVPGEQPQGGKFIKLNTNENPYPPSPKVVAAVKQAAEGRLNLYPDPLARRFCSIAAEQFGVDPDCILPANGSDENLTILMRSFVDAGEMNPRSSRLTNLPSPRTMWSRTGIPSKRPLSTS